MTYSTPETPTSWSVSVGNLILDSASGASLTFVLGVNEPGLFSADWVASQSFTPIPDVTTYYTVSSCYAISSGGPLSSYCSDVTDGWVVGSTLGAVSGGSNFGSPGTWTSTPAPEPSSLILSVSAGLLMSLAGRAWLDGEARAKRNRLR